MIIHAMLMEGSIVKLVVIVGERKNIELLFGKSINWIDLFFVVNVLPKTESILMAIMWIASLCYAIVVTIFYEPANFLIGAEWWRLILFYWVVGLGASCIFLIPLMVLSDDV